MAEPTKSVLLVDYESLQRSLAGAVGETRVADRVGAWLAALESGRLLGPEGVRRHLMVKRCYAGPSVRGKQRDALAAAGFTVVDATDGGTRSSADLHIAMDTIDALTKPEGYQEFIFLSAASELAPLLGRLKANKRTTAIYADSNTPPGDRALADIVLDSATFARFLTALDMPVTEISVPTGGGDRADIEAFARRIHAATNIPLFSPKTFAELFRHLTDEISANGYHFQSTAKNVAERMVASGRSVTRRQVVFIVKGLALKGHVFSTSDTPERLAEVFREQAHYLITSAGITLDERQENLLSAWFLSRAPAAAPRGPAAVVEAPAAAKATIAETIEREVAKAVVRPTPPAVSPKPPVARPTASAVKPIVRPVEMPKSAAKPTPLPSAREEAKAVIAARIAASAKMKPAGSRAPIPAKAAPPPPAPAAEPPPPPVAVAPPPPPPQQERPAPQNSARTTEQQNSDALESSILAAIAEAVDVLVEDSSEEDEPQRHEERAVSDRPRRNSERAAPREDARPAREAQPKKRPANNVSARPANTEPAPPPPPPAQSDADDSDSSDIGDQIQRIIASYNRNRADE